jgi:hypothetical protein
LKKPESWTTLSAEELALEDNSRQQRARFMASSAEVQIPRFLYKFTAWDHPAAVEGTLVNSTVWLSSPSAFNDPFDIRATISLDAWGPKERRRYLTDGMKRQGFTRGHREAIASKVLADDRLDAMLQSSFEANAASIGVCSFAGNARSARSTLMWSHYAKDHTGVCFQFHTIGAPSVFYRARPVTYSKEVVCISWIDTKARAGELFAALHRKSEDWIYEKEYRIVFPESASRVLPFNPRALATVVLGCKAPAAAEDRIVELCRQRSAKGYPPVRLLRAEMLRGKYGVALRLARDLEARLSV